MQRVDRYFETFDGIMEVIDYVTRRTTNARIYIEEEVVAAANEATTGEIEKGKAKFPHFIPKNTVDGLSLLQKIITSNGITNFNLDGEPEGEYYLRLRFKMEC